MNNYNQIYSWINYNISDVPIDPNTNNKRKFSDNNTNISINYSKDNENINLKIMKLNLKRKNTIIDSHLQNKKKNKFDEEKSVSYPRSYFDFYYI